MRINCGVMLHRGKVSQTFRLNRNRIMWYKWHRCGLLWLQRRDPCGSCVDQRGTRTQQFKHLSAATRQSFSIYLAAHTRL